MPRLSIVGCPSSAGSYAAGQELAPAALRAVGLIDVLAATRDVHDDGDLPMQVWRPDRARPLAQNLDQVVANLRQLADRIEPLISQGDDILVLGGNCTIALGVLDAFHRVGPDRPILLYIDRGFDLNVPSSTTDGALDWMGLGHALDLPGAADELADAFAVRPLLRGWEVAWLGVDDPMTTDWEREQFATLGSTVVSSRELVDDPRAAAARALAALPANRPLIVHFDVDVLDFTDAPLAENTDGRNTGPSLDEASAALHLAVRDPRFRALSIGELNPTRSAGDPDAIGRFARALGRVL